MATREEYEFRFELFMKREAEIAESNANPDNTFTLGHNFMSTMTDFEVQKMLGRKKVNSKPSKLDTKSADIPDSWDWREHGAVNPVQN